MRAGFTWALLGALFAAGAAEAKTFRYSSGPAPSLR